MFTKHSHHRARPHKRPDCLHAVGYMQIGLVLWMIDILLEDEDIVAKLQFLGVLVKQNIELRSPGVCETIAHRNGVTSPYICEILWIRCVLSTMLNFIAKSNQVM